jgi:Endodeoxyribonuclease RusA
MRLSGLGSADHIVAALLVCEVSNQLRSQGRGRISRYRYAVEMEIVEGRSQPAKDLDNYAKPILDAVTQSRLLWDDDNQIDELVIRRRRDGNSTDSVVTATLRRLGGQHGGVPTHFRARCLEASQSGGTYSHVGYHFASVLASEIPYDLEEEVWQEEITRLMAMLQANEHENVWNWCREHFPQWIDLVPGPRKSQFLFGVQNAYEEERIGE